MNLAEVKAFMKEVGWGTLGTSDGKVVGVRPMGACLWVEGELWSATGVGSDKAKQLTAVPYAEYCFANAQGMHVRIAGSCTVSTDADDKQKLYDAVPGLADHVDGPTTPDWVVLRMKPDRVRAMTPKMTYEDVSLG